MNLREFLLGSGCFFEFDPTIQGHKCFDYFLHRGALRLVIIANRAGRRIIGVEGGRGGRFILRDGVELLQGLVEFHGEEELEGAVEGVDKGETEEAHGIPAHLRYQLLPLLLRDRV